MVNISCGDSVPRPTSISLTIYVRSDIYPNFFFGHMSITCTPHIVVVKTAAVPQGGYLRAL